MEARDMIEKVARAIAGIAFAESHEGDAESEWEKVQHVARAAIEAMLDATPEMTRVLKPGMDYEEVYTSLIKAALEE